MAKYVFDEDWNQSFRVNAERLFNLHRSQATNYLEIGTYQGRSACWMLDNILVHPQSKLTTVDLNIQEEARSNLGRHVGKVQIIEGDSKIVVPNLSNRFDIIYVDGDHTAMGALFDSVAVWPRCQLGGIILWDDYFDGHGNQVKFAIERFCDCLGPNRFEVLLQNAQLAIRKLRN